MKWIMADSYNKIFVKQNIRVFILLSEARSCFVECSSKVIVSIL